MKHLLATLSLTAALMSSSAYALPIGGDVATGTATISAPTTGNPVTTINQSTITALQNQGAIIDWQNDTINIFYPQTGINFPSDSVIDAKRVNVLPQAPNSGPITFSQPPLPWQQPNMPCGACIWGTSKIVNDIPIRMEKSLEFNPILAVQNAAIQAESKAALSAPLIKEVGTNDLASLAPAAGFGMLPEDRANAYLNQIGLGAQ